MDFADLRVLSGEADDAQAGALDHQGAREQDVGHVGDVRLLLGNGVGVFINGFALALN